MLFPEWKRAAFIIAALSLSVPVILAADKRDDDGDTDYRRGRRVRIGGIMVGASYFHGPAWYPRYPYYGWGYPYWGLYDPFWYSPWVHPGLYSGFAQGPNMGQVKVKSASKEASVYLDGAYAGTLEKLKSMWLEPGAYNLEVRDYGGRSFKKRIYVLTGKTLELRADLQRKGDAQP
jgi:hypothetical protein